MIVQLQFEPRDLWIGVFWDFRGSDLHLWVCLVPAFPFHFIFRRLH